MPNIVLKGQQCVMPSGGELGSSPFSEGADWQLQDEAGVILSRDTLSAGVPDGQYCNFPLSFKSVSTADVKMFVLRNKLDHGWKLMPAEIADSPVVLDFIENPPDDL